MIHVKIFLNVLKISGISNAISWKLYSHISIE